LHADRWGIPNRDSPFFVKEVSFMKENAQLILDGEIKAIQLSNKIPRLFLHSCCAPCSSYVLEYLSEYFSITVFYYNPNISPQSEYRHRVEEEKRLIGEMPVRNKVSFVEGTYEPDRYFEAVKGLENEPEGGARCEKCFRLRLEETARFAASGGYDCFTTTLSISPLKNASLLNEIGQELSLSYHVPYLISDFKKRGGYQRSIELSRIYGLYRQNFCGCIFSMPQANDKR